MIDADLAGPVDEHKALAHPLRLRILAMLGKEPQYVCQITTVLHSAVSTVSTHLAVMKDAGLAIETREGRWVRYALSDRGAQFYSFHREELTAGRDVIADSAILAIVRTIPREDLCQASLDFRKLRNSELIALARKYRRLGKGRIPEAAPQGCGHQEAAKENRKD
ncbi:MAG TPA: metalloregulator ArsR/SmtB family transcription factor [Thermoanaerobaculia bacterium]